jgi:hypothetical protein
MRFGACLTLAAGLAAAEPAEPVVQVAGLRVIAPAIQAEAPRAFNWSPGTGVALAVLKPTGVWISLDPTASRIDRFQDDLGTDLLAVPPAEEGGGRLPAPPPVAMQELDPSGRIAMVGLFAAGIPAPGARTITVSGSLTFLADGQLKTTTHPGVELKPGLRLAAGPLSYAVGAVQPSEMIEGCIDVSWEATGEEGLVKGFRFLGGDGKPVGVEIVSPPPNAGPDQPRDHTLIFPRKPQGITVEIDYYQDARSVKVPFACTIAAGLQPTPKP